MANDFKMLRPLRNGEVKPRARDGFISANELMKIGNYVRVTDDNLPPRLKLADYFVLDDTQDLMETIKSQENITQVKSAGRGRSATTWVHPVLALDFALWMSPSLKYEVYRWMLDQLLLRRMSSSDSFKEMNKALDERYDIKGKYWYYTNTAEAIKRAVGVGDWDYASEEQLLLRDKIQEKIIMLCEEHTSMPFDSLIHRGISTTIARHLT